MLLAVSVLSSVSGKKKPSDSEIQLMELVRFFCEVKVHDHAHYFVDSLWEHCDVLQDWAAMTGLLLDNKTSVTLGDEETRTILEILVCAAHRGAGATPPSGRARNKVRSEEEGLPKWENHERLNLHESLGSCI